MLAKPDIPFFNYPALFAEQRDAYLSAITRCLDAGAFIMQQDLQDFESELASYLGVKHAIGMADGTMALIIALRLAKIGPGDEVIVPSHTFVATAAAVHHVGATPVLADCGPDHMLDIASAQALLTDKTAAIMPVQLNGRTADMHAVCAFANAHNLKIVEDSCQALGAKFDGRFAGTFGVAGSFSFYPAKTLGCFGDGGALIVDDDDLPNEARMYRDHGRNPVTGKVEAFGHNARLDNIQAAILRLKLQHYDEAIAKRRALAQHYCDRLCTIDEIALPPAPNSAGPHFDIFQNFEIEADRRDPLQDHLAKRGIGTLRQWGGNVIHQFEALELRSNAPYAERMSTRFLMLPMHHLLTTSEIDQVCDAVIEFYHH